LARESGPTQNPESQDSESCTANSKRKERLYRPKRIPFNRRKKGKTSTEKRETGPERERTTLGIITGKKFEAVCGAALQTPAKSASGTKEKTRKEETDLSF